MKETIFGMKVFDMALVPSANILVLGCMTYAAPSHKGAIKKYIFIFSQYWDSITFIFIAKKRLYFSLTSF